MRFRRVLGRLRECATVQETLRIVSDECAATFDGAGAAIELLSADVTPVCTVDTLVAFPSADLRMYLDGGFRSDPVLARVRETHQTVSVEDVVADLATYARLFEECAGHAPARPLWTLAGPLVGGGALTGTLRLFRDDPFPASLRSDLSVLSLHVSAAFAKIGVVGVAHPGASQLTQRQQQVVGLAAEGATNREMSGVLAVSSAAIKKHLAIAYDKLQVNNRAELARFVSRNPAVGAPSPIVPGVRTLFASASSRAKRPGARDR